MGSATKNVALDFSPRLIVFFSLLMGLTSGIAAQNQKPSQLFTVLQDEKTLDQTPAQSKRLALIRQLPTTRSVHVVQLNDAALRSNQIAVALSGQKLMNFTKSAGEMRDSRDFTWMGALADEQRGGTTLVVRNGDVTGSIVTPTALYRISPLGGGKQALVEVDRTKLPKDEPDSFRGKESEKKTFVPPSPSPGSANRSDSALTQIDVLVSYTPAAKAGVGDIDGTIALAVAEANQSYVNSGIHIHLNLVDSFGVSYVEKGKSFDTVLSDFVKMGDVNMRREQSGADLAALIIDQSDYCGLADAVMASSSTAFAIVYFDCATGYYSFAHELGHLMGARHDQQDDPITTPFSYGHGYQYIASNPNWRTIMAYDCPSGCQRLQYWSNPSMEYGGNPMGTVATNNNARVLNETAATVAAFKTRPTK